MPTTRKKPGDAAATSSAADPPAEGLKFEQALERLEKIVAEMESAELPLDEVVKRYEEGTKLVRLCSRKLEEAEKKIEILARAKDGTIAAGPFDSSKESGAPDARAKAGEEKLF
jgi:exodeoxyribonuclease VII small subunit